MHSFKKVSKFAKINHYLFTRLVVKAMSIVLLSKTSQYQGEAGFVRLNFQNGISQNTGKCELGQFSLRQSHIRFILYDHVHHNGL